MLFIVYSIRFSIKCDAIPGRSAELSYVYSGVVCITDNVLSMWRTTCFHANRSFSITNVNQFYTYLYRLYVDNKKIVL